MREIKRFIVNITMVDSIYKDMLCVGLYICSLTYCALLKLFEKINRIVAILLHNGTTDTRDTTDTTRTMHHCMHCHQPHFRVKACCARQKQLFISNIFAYTPDTIGFDNCACRAGAVFILREFMTNVAQC